MSATPPRIAAVVYLIDADQGVKIGITRFSDVAVRRRDLERSAGQPLQVLRAWTIYELLGSISG